MSFPFSVLFICYSLSFSLSPKWRNQPNRILLVKESFLNFAGSVCVYLIYFSVYCLQWMLHLVYIPTRKAMEGKNALFLVLAAAPWAGLDSLKAAGQLLLGKENCQQDAGPRPHSEPDREAKMQGSAVPWNRERDAPGKCRSTEKLKRRREGCFPKKPEETVESFWQVSEI